MIFCVINARYTRGIMVKGPERVFRPRHYIHFQKDTLGNGMNPYILASVMSKIVDQTAPSSRRLQTL